MKGLPRTVFYMTVLRGRRRTTRNLVLVALVMLVGGLAYHKRCSLGLSCPTDNRAVSDSMGVGTKWNTTSTGANIQYCYQSPGRQ